MAFKLWSMPRKRSTAPKLLGTENAIRIGGYTLGQAGESEPNVSLEFWADDRRYVLQVPLDKVDNVCERLQESKARQEQWLMQLEQRKRKDQNEL